MDDLIEITKGIIRAICYIVFWGTLGVVIYYSFPLSLLVIGLFLFLWGAMWAFS